MGWDFDQLMMSAGAAVHLLGSCEAAQEHGNELDRAVDTVAQA